MLAKINLDPSIHRAVICSSARPPLRKLTRRGEPATEFGSEFSVRAWDRPAGAEYLDITRKLTT